MSTDIRCRTCGSRLPDAILDELVARADESRARGEDMGVTLQCPCGRLFLFALDTDTMKIAPLYKEDPH